MLELSDFSFQPVLFFVKYWITRNYKWSETYRYWSSQWQWINDHRRKKMFIPMQAHEIYTHSTYTAFHHSPATENICWWKKKTSAIYLYIDACLLNDNAAIKETLAILLIRKQHWCSQIMYIVCNYKGVLIIHFPSFPVLHHSKTSKEVLKVHKKKIIMQ